MATCTNWDYFRDNLRYQYHDDNDDDSCLGQGTMKSSLAHPHRMERQTPVDDPSQEQHRQHLRLSSSTLFSDSRSVSHVRFGESESEISSVSTFIEETDDEKPVLLDEDHDNSHDPLSVSSDMIPLTPESFVYIVPYHENGLSMCSSPDDDESFTV